MWRTRTKVVAFCVLLAALYNDWLLGPTLDARMPVGGSLISELSARTQTNHWAFQTLDITAGVLTLAALPWLWRFLRGARVMYWQVLFATIASIGADSIVDALLPISCSPTVDAGCSLAGTHSLLTDAHLIESTLIGVITFVAPILWWRLSKTKHHFIARLSWQFAVLQLLVGGSILLTRSVHFDVTGTLQRTYELGIGAWVAGILYVAISADNKRRTGTTEPEPARAQPAAPNLTLSYETSEE
jgi:uncharacterized protein DUF998